MSTHLLSTHAQKRMKERFGIDLKTQQTHFVKLVLSQGKRIMKTGETFIYKIEFKGKTMFPVMSKEKNVITVLTEDMVREKRKKKKKFEGIKRSYSRKRESTEDILISEVLCAHI